MPEMMSRCPRAKAAALTLAATLVCSHVTVFAVDQSGLASELHSLVEGRVLAPHSSEEAYEEASRGWMAPGLAIDQDIRPAVILQPKGGGYVEAAWSR